MKNINNVGIMSDSHDNMPAIKAAIDFFNQKKVDLVIHAGDLVAPFTSREIKKLNCPYKIVLGNNDGEIFGLFRIFEGNVYHPPYRFSINDKRILVLHDPIMLDDLQYSKTYDIIIYGHDHNPIIKKLDNRPLIINPGECGGWLSGKCTVATWDVISNDANIHELVL